MKFFALFPAKFSDLIDRTLKITQNTRRRGRACGNVHSFAFFVLRRAKRARAAGRCADWAAGFSAPPPTGMVFCRKQRKKLQKKAPLPGELSAKLTERLSQIWYDLSVSAFRRATSPGRGGLGERTPMASPMRGSCRRRRLMRWGQLRRRRSVHLIRHGSAVPPSPRRGRHGAAPAQKKRPSRSGRALGMGAYSV